MTKWIILNPRHPEYILDQIESARLDEERFQLLTTLGEMPEEKERQDGRS